MTESERCDCKIGRVIEAFDLTGIDDELVAHRTGEQGSPASLRELTDRFNRAVLQHAVADAGETPLDGEVANAYRLLTADEVGRGNRTRIRKQLEGAGVDVGAIEGAFVSHPTMGSHLSDCLGVERPTDDADRRETAKERVFKLQSRGEAVTRDALDGLASAGELSIGQPTVTVDARVTCETCGVHASVGEFIDRGGCDCNRPDSR